MGVENKTAEIKNKVCEVIKGKDEIIEKILAAVLAGGHILLEDIPGVGKTTMAMTFSKTMSLEYKRVQFTPDILPSDITGFTMYNNKTQEFEYKQGAIMCNLFLADEINRTSPKTQSALLEVMEEGRVTIDGITREVPSPFVVIATQNPVGSSGTQRLPESQLDRFMLRLSMGYPDHENAIQILKGNVGEVLKQLESMVSLKEVKQMQEAVSQVFVQDTILEYIIILTEKTREEEVFQLGVSPRGSIALLKMAKGMAFLAGRDYVIPEDIQQVFVDVFGHRVVLSTRARAQGIQETEALRNVLEKVDIPKRQA